MITNNNIQVDKFNLEESKSKINNLYNNLKPDKAEYSNEINKLFVFSNRVQYLADIVSAWCDKEGICFGQKAVKEKQNEIVAIPELLDTLQIKGYIVTIYAMGIQTEIALILLYKALG